MHVHTVHLLVCVSNHMQVRDDADCTFISEVFAGCVRYQSLIKVFDPNMQCRCMSGQASRCATNWPDSSNHSGNSR